MLPASTEFADVSTMITQKIPLVSISALAAIAAITFACRKNPTASGSSTVTSADMIFHNGSILNMAGKTPAYVAALAIKDIKVMETFKEGKSIYTAAN
jgi:hypothetical protein